MKLFFTLAFVSFWLNAHSQCAKLYIREHLSGDPICYLSEGDFIEICLETNEVYGCPRNLYIINKGANNGSFTYELSLDRGYGVYVTLIVNTNTKRLGFIIQGQSAMYSYQSEYEIQKEEEAKQIFLAEERKRKLQDDTKRYSSIDNLLSDRKIKDAYGEYSKLFYPTEYYNHSQVEKEYNLLIVQTRESERKEDQVILSLARKEINENGEPLQYWNKINHKEDYLTFFNDTIFNWIIKSIGTVPEINLTSSEVDQFIQLNKDALISYIATITPNNSINILFNKQGVSNIPNLILTQKIFKTISGINIYHPTNIVVPVQITEKVDRTKSTKFYANTSSQLAISMIGYHIYKVNLLTTNFLIGDDLISHSLDSTLSEKQIKIVEPYIQKINLNGKPFKEKSIEKSITEDLSPRILKKSFRILSLAFWGGVIAFIATF
jgi:hypothetical protein